MSGRVNTSHGSRCRVPTQLDLVATGSPQEGAGRGGKLSASGRSVKPLPLPPARAPGDPRRVEGRVAEEASEAGRPSAPAAGSGPRRGARAPHGLGHPGTRGFEQQGRQRRRLSVTGSFPARPGPQEQFPRRAGRPGGLGNSRQTRLSVGVCKAPAALSEGSRPFGGTELPGQVPVLEPPREDGRSPRSSTPVTCVLTYVKK